MCIAISAHRSSDEHGLCYIDTQNLDGEANLKQREVPRGILDKVDKMLQIYGHKTILYCATGTNSLWCLTWQFCTIDAPSWNF